MNGHRDAIRGARSALDNAYRNYLLTTGWREITDGRWRRPVAGTLMTLSIEGAVGMEEALDDARLLPTNAEAP
jgi:hypothetical protein